MCSVVIFLYLLDNEYTSRIIIGSVGMGTVRCPTCSKHGETVLLLHPPLSLVGVSIGMERGFQ